MLCNKNLIMSTLLKKLLYYFADYIIYIYKSTLFPFILYQLFSEVDYHLSTYVGKTIPRLMIFCIKNPSYTGAYITV